MSGIRQRYLCFFIVVFFGTGFAAAGGRDSALIVYPRTPQAKEVQVGSSWKDKLFYEYSGRVGSIIELTPDMSAKRWGETIGVSTHIGVGIQTRGDKYWQRFFGYPRYGVRVAYTAYTGSVFGDAISLYPFFQGPIFRANRFSLEYGIGYGASYHTKRRDPVTNPYNHHIHTRFTGYIDLSLLGEYQLSDHFDIFAGVNFSHNSNARTHRPNRGTNVPNVAFGLRYHPKPRLVSQWHRDVPKPEYKKNEVYLAGSAFFNTMNRGEEQIYHFCSTLEAGYFRRFHPCMKYGAAVDLFYVDGYKDYRSYRDKDGNYHRIGGSNWNNLTLGLCGMFEIMFGQVAFRGAVGYVVMNRGAATVDIYERFGFYYYFGRKTQQFVGTGIKVLRGKAEFMEITYGINLWRF